MAQSINLIPQREKVEQQKTQIVKVSTVFSVLILVIVGLIAGYFFYQTSRIKKQTASLNEAINVTRGEIVNLSQIEISARNLGKKYQTLTSIFEGRVYYSLLAEELLRRTPPSVKIENLTIGYQQEITVSGTGTDYLAISQFVNRLTEKLASQDVSHKDNIFTDVTLNTVNLEAQTGRVRYFIVVKFDKELLKK